MSISSEAQEYLECFSKFEYALMELGYYELAGRCIECKNSGFLSCDWGRFKSEKLSNLTLEELKNISDDTEYLIGEPPKKRIVVNNKLVWKEVPITSYSDAIDACRRIRNNLVHGGKYNDDDVKRNTQLLGGAVDILKKLLEHDRKLKDYYDNASM